MKLTELSNMRLKQVAVTNGLMLTATILFEPDQTASSETGCFFKASNLQEAES
ncbi:hypothetical protein JOC78_002911 [Bacillus ectoiniformans]|uniref:hypothetical protein n=1 Tax=Bacillus ectoiniformans TaxID=1494429 RepID=UPI00195B80FA|nr:hypothetical protein [Bacillus ectoiniformans]MBM7649927.1 hypothetical protein [Bacillus ectoiniformans]